MSGSVGAQPFFASRRRVSRGFHRLGIFLALVTLVIFLIVGAQKYDPLSWWIGGLLIAPIVYGLARLAGWTINGFTEPDVVVPAQVQPPALDPPIPSHASIAPKPVQPSTRPVIIPGERLPTPAQEEPKGVGGWLILPVIGLMVAPFKLGAVTVELIQSLYGLPSTTNAAVKLLLIGELTVNCALFALAIYALAKLKGQKQQFPMIYIVLFGASIVAMIADQLAAYYLLNLRPDNKELRTALVTVVAFGIWGPYMLYSKRVRNTFVH